MSVVNKIISSALVDAVWRVSIETPDRIAVTDTVGHLTYHELWDFAQELAELISLRASPECKVVAMRMSRSRFAPVAMLAIRIAGFGYVPIDPQYPHERQLFMLEDSGAELELSNFEADAQSVLLDRWGPIGIYLRKLPSRTLEYPDDLCYIIYTSGSTGLPKGCLIRDNGVLEMILAIGAELDFSIEESWSAIHSFCFDVSVFEIWGPLIHGAECVIASEEEKMMPRDLLQRMAVSRISIASMTPTMLSLILQEDTADSIHLPDLRYVLLAGEAMRLTDVAALYSSERFAHTEVINLYGITEGTVHCTLHRISRGDSLGNSKPGATPIGHPLRHLDIRIVRTDGSLAALWESGEMIVSGSGIAWGYLGRPELTRERFTLNSNDGSASYQTGDWGFLDEDARLWYVGRRDNQVKIRGHRIELGELESALRGISGIQDVVCALIPTSSDREVLGALLVGDEQRLRTNPVRKQLSKILPNHMIPARIVFVDQIPTTSSGKADRTKAVELILIDRNIVHEH